MEQMYDVVIVGGGPAGLTAALYLARARYRCLVLEKACFGGQIAITDEVVNYPGIAKTSGKDLTDTIKAQAESFGAEFLTAEATGFDIGGAVKTVRTRNGDFRCLGVLIATGAHPRNVGFAGEEAYKGRGVAYCATCDGEFFTGKEVFVVGGGYAAAEESVFLTKFARHVTVLVRKDDFSCAASVAERAKNHEKITVLTNTVMEEVSGERGLTYARYRNTRTGEVTHYRSDDRDCFGVFVFAGYAPATESLKGIVECNEQGYIVTDASQKTNVDGVYAAGDVCIKPLRQVVTATGDGALAATELEKYVAAMQQKTGLRADGASANIEKEPPAIRRTEDSGELFSSEMRAQLENLLGKMEQTLLLKLYLDERSVSGELEQMMTSLAELSDRLRVESVQADASGGATPYVSICYGDGRETGLAFHGVPAGHEFTGFVLALYNAAGPGQPLEESAIRAIAEIEKPVDLKILVTLSCTMCPDLVIAAQRIAAQNPNIRAHVYDIRHFEAMRQHYRVMSVPCLVINDENVHFGKKDFSELLRLISQ